MQFFYFVTGRNKRPSTDSLKIVHTSQRLVEFVVATGWYTFSRSFLGYNLLLSVDNSNYKHIALFSNIYAAYVGTKPSQPSFVSKGPRSKDQGLIEM